jgi:hypothetical protein
LAAEGFGRTLELGVETPHFAAAANLGHLSIPSTKHTTQPTSS